MSDELKAWKERDQVLIDQADVPYFNELKMALDSDEWIKIIYFGGSQPGQTRLIKPLHFFRVEGQPEIYLRAFCDSRGSERTFRLDKLKIEESNTANQKSIVSQKSKAEHINGKILDEVNNSPGLKAIILPKNWAQDQGELRWICRLRR